jgi:hypothetical protein
MPTGALWQLQGVLEWLHLGHSPTKVPIPYHELVARLTAKGCTRELLGHETSNIVPISKDQQHWLWQFSDLWQSALANFSGQVREHLPHSKLFQFASLHVFVFPKIILSSTLLEAVTIFTDASGHGAAVYYTKDCHKVEHTFLPLLKWWSSMLLPWSSGTFFNNLSICTMIATMWWVFYAALKLLISAILVVKSYLIFYSSWVVWCKPSFIFVL